MTSDEKQAGEIKQAECSKNDKQKDKSSMDFDKLTMRNMFEYMLLRTSEFGDIEDKERWMMLLKNQNYGCADKN